MSDAIESCEVCGFVWDAIDPREVPRRLIATTDVFATVLRSEPTLAVQRPDHERWSALEYGCHVRDALTNVRDRMILGLVEDAPTPAAMYGPRRVELGLYSNDTPEQLAGDLIGAGEQFARTMRAMPDDSFDRTIFYGWPAPGYRELRWVAAQALHETEHHLTDAQENIAGLG
jgi:hypothetical protein